MELSDHLKKRIEKQIASGKYKNTEEVLDEALFVLEQEENYGPEMTLEELEQSLIEAMKEEPIPVTKEFWDQLREDCRKRVQTRSAASGA